MHKLVQFFAKMLPGTSIAKYLGQGQRYRPADAFAPFDCRKSENEYWRRDGRRVGAAHIL